MRGPGDGEDPGTRRRLVLGFDDGCAACSDLARRVEEQVGDEIEVVSLRDPRVEEWRFEALGEDASWAPALFAVDGPEVRAWTGRQLGIRLGRLLGRSAAQRVV